MFESLLEAIERIDPGASLTLSVGWRSGQKVKLSQLVVGDEVAAALREVLDETLSDLRERTPEVWAPDADLSAETYLVVGDGDLGVAPMLASEHRGATLAAVLLNSAELDVLSPEDLPAADLSFYAVTVGSDPSARATFLRRSNPRRGLRRGRLMTSYRDVLKRIDDPVFAFDELIDLVFVEGQVLVLSQSSFAAIFRGQATLMEQVPKWTTELASHVQISGAGQERLTAKATRDSRARTRLEAIVKRGHLADVGPEQIKSTMRDVGLDPDRLVDVDGNLVLEDDDISMVLQFLNEDLFIGALTNAGFRADRKAPR